MSHIRQMSDRNLYRRSNPLAENAQPRSHRPSQDERYRAFRTEQSIYQHTFADYFKPNINASKISTRSATSQNSCQPSRRSTITEARSLERDRGNACPPTSRQDGSIFSDLSSLLKYEDTLISKYKDKLDTSKTKVATIFQHLKDDIKIILEKQEYAICEELNSRYKSFIYLFENTKQQIHRLYDQKIRFFNTHQNYMNEINENLNEVIRMKSNFGLLNQMKTQNSQALYARKYEAFFENKKQQFEELSKMKRQIDKELEEDIFDYSGNIAKLKQLKQNFQASVQNMFICIKVSTVKGGYGL